MMMSPLQKYMLQQQLAAEGQGPRGGGGEPAVPMGPGIADPYNEGEDSPALVNPEDDQNEFDPRRRRPYLDQADMPMNVNSTY